ncbi:unnamed protein product [Protopolystoma xenopodis]|uniref:APAF-1 helical domain-containing protein n=1 Tax=Protopolystoma xenopodis TaxID=117903 RepID=A0A3S5CB91_9PLAT|nr:unnamed protein product [Protopolystoma xenopodis]
MPLRHGVTCKRLPLKLCFSKNYEGRSMSHQLPDLFPQYHAEFVDAYAYYCNWRWRSLNCKGDIHTYFWRNCLEHLRLADRRAGLIALLLDLDFIAGRLCSLGPSLVIADFRAYKSIFLHEGHIPAWYKLILLLNAYINFLQTHAHYVVDPAAASAAASREQADRQARLRLRRYQIAGIEMNNGQEESNRRWSLDAYLSEANFAASSAGWQAESQIDSKDGRMIRNILGATSGDGHQSFTHLMRSRSPPFLVGGTRSAETSRRVSHGKFIYQVCLL